MMIIVNIVNLIVRLVIGVSNSNWCWYLLTDICGVVWRVPLKESIYICLDLLMYLVQLRLGSQSSFYKVYKIVWDYPINREYFKEVSIETETIVETIENGQGCDLKKIETRWFQGCDSGLRSQPWSKPCSRTFQGSKLPSKPWSQPCSQPWSQP